MRVKDKAVAKAEADVKASIAKMSEAIGSDGRILVRENGTEPIVHVMLEVGDMETCQKYVDSVVDVIIAKGYLE